MVKLARATDQQTAIDQLGGLLEALAKVAPDQAGIDTASSSVIGFNAMSATKAVERAQASIQASLDQLNSSSGIDRGLLSKAYTDAAIALNMVGAQTEAFNFAAERLSKDIVDPIKYGIDWTGAIVLGAAVVVIGFFALRAYRS
jgi:hypothetical protein